ncbi:MAG: hypothetical protein H6660_02400 [Ardenticatenaceae bacterium]|nr:hypothetical protein [Ardenticatenaceae bacterium]
MRVRYQPGNRGAGIGKAIFVAAVAGQRAIFARNVRAIGETAVSETGIIATTSNTETYENRHLIT